ncbi:NAD(P)H-dependent oxidoreductase [Pseudoruegeria sp. SK021]|uniref:NAD(P)H-dependent oxidoreductase n=1 Tax=Pseudoruegeria sp. SK021 TaxID=1933035 RepID=UPI000A262A65|nr:NAD(P)H-dependent oxidoreductase [Pseudoruegeria sp. SK021]OSP55842.1 NAD(P)H dehydrogenase [Pseudoruegeria sp. SK021]
MKVHVIYAHPLANSLAARLHEVVVDSLTEAGHEVDDLDLYADGFDPVLSAQGREDYHDTAINQAPVASYVERLKAADALVLCHPVWNFGWPAILKGYFDRVFLPDVSFRFEDNKIGPGLTNIRKLATVTTYGAKHWRAMVLGDPPRKNATRFLRVICHPKVQVQYNALYAIDTATPQKIDRYLAQVRRKMLAF